MATSLKNQRMKILEHLEDGFPIDTMFAFREFGITRLSARIFELKDAGYNIKSQMVKSKDENGDPVHYKEYWIPVGGGEA